MVLVHLLSMTEPIPRSTSLKERKVRGGKRKVSYQQLVNFLEYLITVSFLYSETQHFFLALRMCGIDFTLMATMFPGRKRFELKRKYVKESSSNPNLLQEILDTKEPLNEDKLRCKRSF